jgi:hypothetical protein
MATVTAQLQLTSGRPASGALLEVTPPGGPAAIGLADREGTVLLYLPYPEPENVLLSPPSSPLRSLAAQSWEVGVKVFYRPGAADERVTDLCAALEQAPAAAADVIAQPGSPPTLLTGATLKYGQPLTLHTFEKSELLIEPT